MGLTIHYSFRFQGSLDEATAKLEQLRQKALDMSFESVSDIRHFMGESVDFNKYREGPDEEWRWALIQAQGNVNRKLKDSGSVGYNVTPIEAIIFRTWPGEGCEEANFGLCRYPDHIIGSNKRRIKTRLDKGWRWGSFCKTQYANEKGILNFLRCHTLVIAMLDQAKGLGQLHEVHDEGHYWKRRNLKALAEEVGEWDRFVAGFTGVLESALGRDNLVSAIAESPPYERLKELGMQHLDQRALAQWKALFEDIKTVAEAEDKKPLQPKFF